MLDELLTDPLLVLIKEAGLAEVTDLEKVQGEHNLSGKPVSKLLQDEGILGTAEQLELIAEFLGTDVIDLSEVNFDEQLLSTVPVEAAKLYQALPVRRHTSGGNGRSLKPDDHRRTGLSGSAADCTADR